MGKLIGALFVLLIILLAPAGAEPARYVLDQSQSSVIFTYRLMRNATTGTMPVLSADLSLDFRDLGSSKVMVVLDAAHARTSAPIAAGALTGPKMIDAAHYPEIRFESRSVKGSLEAAQISGTVTINGISRPLVLLGRVYRAGDSDPGDLSRLTVLLSGHLNRRDFRADGYPDVVDDRVDLDITARLVRR
jgi:polyisoprenoid-binding protein YceI